MRALCAFVITLCCTGPITGIAMSAQSARVFKSNKVTTAMDMAEIPLKAHFQRHRRSQYGQELQQQLVDFHNNLRRKEGASNMQKLVRFSSHFVLCI